MEDEAVGARLQPQCLNFVGSETVRYDEAFIVSGPRLGGRGPSRRRGATTPTSARDQKANIELLEDPFARNALRTAYHLRKYSLLYICGVLGLIALLVFPTVGNNSTQTQTASNIGTGSGPAVGSSGPGSTGPAASAGGTAVSGAVKGNSAAGAGTARGDIASGPIGVVESGGGVTRSGARCAPGVHQIPWSAYADMCVAKFSGNNGGKTYNGVDANTITIAARQTSDSQGANALEAQAEAEAAGGVSSAQSFAYDQKIVSWMNSQFELYGRKVKLVQFNGQGNGTNEALGQGQAQACADADQEATSIKAFGAINWAGIYETGPLSDCAARYHMYVPNGAAYFPEWWFKQRNPYVWGVTMNCTLIADEVGEFGGKQIAPFPAKWAGNDGVQKLTGKQRKFGTYVPNNPEYQSCVQEFSQQAQTKYHVAKNRFDYYNYALDISTFPQDAQKAIVQFAANKDTTVTLACDPISPIFLTQDAVNQNYFPEWLIIGVAGTDADNWAQLWDQSAIKGRLFGISETAATQTVLSPNSDAGQSLRKMGIPINISSVTDYYLMLSMFNQLQQAGPNLTPASIAAGSPKIPTATGALGTWDFGNTHSAIVDAREVYWDGSKTSPGNGKTGTYIQIYGGKRFRLGQFPSGSPAFFG